MKLKFFFLALIILGLIFLVYMKFFAKGIFNHSPRSPKISVPVTYELGWWPEQYAMEIDSLKVEILESNLDLYNSTSLIRYTVKGRLKSDKNDKRIISQVHISQRFKSITKGTEINNGRRKEAIIEITPIVKSLNDTTSFDGETYFEFSNEMHLKSYQWGKNTTIFQSDTLQQVVEVFQRK